MRRSSGLLLFILAFAGVPPAHATFVGDLVYCDVNNDGVYNLGDGDFGLNDVQVTMTCTSNTGQTCFSGSTTTGPAVLNTRAVEQLGQFCGPALTWDPFGGAGAVQGRYLFEIAGTCSEGERPAVCSIEVTGGLPNDCDTLGTPRVTSMGNMPARPVDTNQDGDFCDAQTGFIPPDDGPFPEGQTLGNLPAYGGCEARPDPAPGDNLYTVVVGPGADECSIYNDFGFTPPAPSIDIEKATNGVDADDPNAGDAPQIGPGDPVTWSYLVTNTGPVTLFNVSVTDDQGIAVNCPTDTLEPGDSITCVANGFADDLFNTGFTTVPGLCGNIPERPLYENMGRVTGETAQGQFVEDDDPSHYCNPPGPDIDIEKATNGVDADDPNAGDAPQIDAGDPVTWSYVVTNTGDVPLVNVQVVDDQGVLVNCPQDTLAVGEAITCIANGIAEDLGDTGFTTVPGLCGGIPQRPLYENMGMATGQTVAGQFVDDVDPSHYCNPPPPPDCGLTVQKACALPPPPAPPVGKCSGKLQQYTVIWNGAGPITVGLGDGLTGSSQTTVQPGQEVTFFTDGSTNDTIVNIGGSITGQSTFHVSCSDGDMDGDTSTNDDQQQVSPVGRDCGKDQGDGKAKSGFINQWLLEGFIDADGAALDCTVDTTPDETACQIQAVAADCDIPGGKPENLTWLYSGGGCAASDNDQISGDLFCTGAVDGTQAVTITDDNGNVFNVAPGGTFTTTRSNSKEFTLTNVGGTENSGRHVSCSQPLQAGDVYGSLTLAALEGAGLGSNIEYSYLVTNGGAEPVTGITVVDNQLGLVGTINALAPGASDTLTATAFITATTTNVATAGGAGAPGAICAADSNPVTVTVLPPPDCEAIITLDEIKEDAIKWDLGNNATQRKATMDTFTLVFPADYGLIKEIKLDGGVFKASDSSNFPNGIASGQTIGPDDWTEGEVAKRRLDPGEMMTLEVKFTSKFKNAGPGDLDLIVTFEEGCSVNF